LNTVAVDVDAFALHNAFELNHPDEMSGPVALVNIGHEVTNVNIVEDGVPILTRDLPTGTRRIKEDLQRDRGLGSDEAAALLRGFDRSEDLDAVLETRGGEIAAGIERAVAFLASSSRSGALVTSVFVCGGGSRVPGLIDVLADRLRMPVQAANPLANLVVRDGAFGTLVTEEVAPLLMLPLGLALRKPS
jgi:type IV pilus assembly protein PilM